MLRLTLPIVSILAMLSACSASPTATSSVGLAGTYDCFGISNGTISNLGTLSLNSDGTGSFGAEAFQWWFDPSASQVSFQGGAVLQDADYLADGQTLSVNLAATGSVENAPDGHFTCVRL